MKETELQNTHLIMLQLANKPLSKMLADIGSHRNGRKTGVSPVRQLKTALILEFLEYPTANLRGVGSKNNDNLQQQ